jgi:hypothetical protein
MKTWQGTVLLFVSALLAGCGELETAPTEVSHDAVPPMRVPTDGIQPSISTGSQQPPSDVPEDFQGHYTWLDVSVDVGWSSPTVAYGQSIVRYWASNATSTIELKVRNAQGTQVGENSATSQAWWLIPWRSTLYASTSVTVSGTCGQVAQAKATGSVWDSAISSSKGWLSWGNQTATATNSAVQPECAPTRCLDPSASNYYGPLPCTYATAPTGGGDGSTTGTSGSTPPPTYQPAPFVPSGHWECNIYFIGTDYEREYCTWYADYTRLPTAPSLALIAADASARTVVSADLPSVFIIVSDQVPADAMAVIERHRQGPFRNVLLVSSSTVRPAVLVAALRALADSRARDGETPSKDLQLTLKGGVLDAQIPATAREYAARFASLIASAKSANAGAYGVRPILELRLDDRK